MLRRRRVVDAPPAGAGGAVGDVANALRLLRDLSADLELGLDAAAADRIASVMTTILDSDGVVVTSLDEVLSAVGVTPANDVIEAQLDALLERRRWERPTAYEAGQERGGVQVVAAVLAVDSVPAGTIHVVHRGVDPNLLSAVGELVEAIGNLMLTNELRSERSAAAVSELRALRAQISPHFIHNSLTAIAGFVHQDPMRARTLIARFAEFLRASFRTDAEFTTIGEEIRLVEIYLDLEQARFGDRFEMTLRIAPEVLGVRLPCLTLQPIVENAIRHGLEHRETGGRLLIVVEDHLTECRITVDDNGVGTDPAALLEALQGRRPSQHIGVLAVDERLRSSFGPEYGLVISTATDAGTRVSMRIPKSGTAWR